MVRFNKLGLDRIAAVEEPNPSDQVEEVHSYTPVQSAPLHTEKIIYIDIGTAHSVAVTGKEMIQVISLKKIICSRLVEIDLFHGGVK